MTKKSAYSGSDIDVLTGLEPIQQNPGMFIGETIDPSHLLTECLDNALDEVLNGYGTTVLVKFDTATDTYIVADDGRGIPIDKKKGQRVPILISSYLFSGGKFTNSAYEISAGLHGVGLSAVNALSDHMSIEIYRDGMHFLCEYENSVLKNEVYEKSDKEKPPFSTKIKFKPSKKYFQSTKIDPEKFKERLNFTSIFTPNNFKFVLYIDDVMWYPERDKQKIIFDLFSKHKDKDMLSSLHRVELSVDDKENKKNKRKLIVYYYYTSNNTKELKGSVNLLPVHAGTHINMFQNTLMNVFEKLKKKTDHFKKEDSLVGIRVLVNLFVSTKEFDSQVKNRLSMSKEPLKELYDTLEKNLMSDLKPISSTLIDYFNKYRGALSKTKNFTPRTSSARGIINKKSKLKDCVSTSVKSTELFLVEGDSAAGNACKARNVDKHAILPLKGKVMNIVNASMSKALNNDEIVDILSSIGANIKEPEKSHLRYGKVVMLCDADADGGHIASLLIGLFLKMFPKILDDGKLYWCRPPLYGYWLKKKFYPMWTEDEMIKAKKKNPGVKIHRYKGLGEMSAEELAYSAFDDSTRYLVQLNSPENTANIFKALQSASFKWDLVSKTMEEIKEKYIKQEVKMPTF